MTAHRPDWFGEDARNALAAAEKVASMGRGMAKDQRLLAEAQVWAILELAAAIDRLGDTP